MHSNKNFRLIAILALALAGMALVASQAVAHGNHRGDRQARLDGDKDGASNRCEIQASLDRASTDSDGNGTIDGLEDSDGDGANNAAESKLRTNCAVANKRFKVGKATVKSYSAEAGLTLAIGKRGLITAAVSDRVICEQDEPDTTDSSASISRHGEDDGEDDDVRREDRGDEPGDDRGGREDERGDDRGDDRRSGDDNDENDTVACTVADLTEGASVLRAKVKNGVFTRIHLAAADEGDF